MDEYQAIIRGWNRSLDQPLWQRLGGLGGGPVWLQQDAEVPLTACAKNRHLRVDLKVSGVRGQR